MFSHVEAHERLVDLLGFDVALLDEIDEWSVSEGDATAFDVNHSTGVIVLGNVVVDSFYVGENAHAVIVGNVVCDNAGIFGALTVYGDVQANSYIVARSFNDYGMEVHGTVTAKLFIEDGTATFAKRFVGAVW